MNLIMVDLAKLKKRRPWWVSSTIDISVMIGIAFFGLWFLHVLGFFK